MTEWEIERGVTCVICPDCAFTFDAAHIDDNGGRYSCPNCRADDDVLASLARQNVQFNMLSFSDGTGVSWGLSEGAPPPNVGDEIAEGHAPTIAAALDAAVSALEAARAVGPEVKRGNAGPCDVADCDREATWVDVGDAGDFYLCSEHMRP